MIRTGMKKGMDSVSMPFSFLGIQHLELFTEMIQARVKKDWDADIAAFDRGEDHIITLADALTEGIIKQFPNQF